MSLDVVALRESFELVVERSPELTRRFYEILFERFPQTRPMFRRNTPAQQEKMLTAALVAVVDHLEDAPWLGSTLQALGARHVDYGVRDEMYAWVGECLLATLAEVAADDWTPRYAKAWQDAYAAISGLMLEGARQFRAAAPSQPDDTERSPAAPRSRRAADGAPISTPAS
jgi:hemoglobin-like flavoprotein